MFCSRKSDERKMVLAFAVWCDVAVCHAPKSDSLWQLVRRCCRLFANRMRSRKWPEACQGVQGKIVQLLFAAMLSCNLVYCNPAIPFLPAVLVCCNLAKLSHFVLPVFSSPPLSLSLFLRLLSFFSRLLAVENTSMLFPYIQARSKPDPTWDPASWTGHGARGTGWEAQTSTSTRSGELGRTGARAFLGKKRTGRGEKKNGKHGKRTEKWDPEFWSSEVCLACDGKS